ncbi:MAG: hypothetical protein M3O30_14825 [Planctomycetota bacterium]|nr:hypothetical protein [Planctomycetota bacterium]
MLTVRHIERLWNARKYGELLNELISIRLEAVAQPDLSEKACIAAAALGVIRLDELNQGYVPACSKLIRAIIAGQERDGGWGNAMTTALCLAALTRQQGQGPAVDRGMTYLAQLQQADGIWPRIPMRRMPEDATASAFVLLQLGDNHQFRETIRYEAAMAWFRSHNLEGEPAAQALWNRARVRSMLVESNSEYLQFAN